MTTFLTAFLAVFIFFVVVGAIAWSILWFCSVIFYNIESDFWCVTLSGLWLFFWIAFFTAVGYCLTNH